GGQAGSAHVADDLALADIAAHADAGGVATHVSVQGLVGLAVLDDDGVAIAALAAHVDHPAVAGRLDRGAGGCGIVHTLVGADLVQYRVAPTRVESGADTGKFHRGTDEGLAHAGAVGAVIAGMAIGIGIAHGGIGVAAVGEACSEDVAGADPFAVNLLFLVQDFKAVALPDFLGEVHVITE